jgi:hypothetical protein
MNNDTNCENCGNIDCAVKPMDTRFCQVKVEKTCETCRYLCKTIGWSCVQWEAKGEYPPEKDIDRIATGGYGVKPKHTTVPTGTFIFYNILGKTHLNQRIDITDCVKVAEWVDTHTRQARDKHWLQRLQESIADSCHACGVERVTFRKKDFSKLIDEFTDCI